MPPVQQRLREDASAQRLMVITMGVISLVVIAGFVWFVWSAKHSASDQKVSEPRLSGAIRPGSPEFDEFRPRIVLDPPEADQAKRALGDWVMTLRTTARNFTGHTIRGLEIHAAVIDHQGIPVKERTIIIIPGRQAELEPSKMLPVAVMLEGMKDSDDRAGIKMDVAAFKFE